MITSQEEAVKHAKPHLKGLSNSPAVIVCEDGMICGGASVEALQAQHSGKTYIVKPKPTEETV